MTMRIQSDAFSETGPIPQQYTGEGTDEFPPLTWSGAPDGTRELALICEDPDAPRYRPFVHAVLYGIDPGARTLSAANLPSVTAGRNDFERIGYGGPMPPTDHGVHHYYFQVFALDAPLKLAPGATKDELVRAMKGHILDQGQLIGTYERRGTASTRPTQ